MGRSSSRVNSWAGHATFLDVGPAAGNWNALAGNAIAFIVIIHTTSVNEAGETAGQCGDDYSGRVLPEGGHPGIVRLDAGLLVGLLPGGTMVTTGIEMG